NVDMLSDEVNEVSNANIDIDKYASETYGELTYYYASVQGEILNGVAIPSSLPRSLASSSGSSQSDYSPAFDVDKLVTEANLPVDKNTDALRIFIDSDYSSVTGYSVHGMSIGADKMVEIEGVYGIITKSVICDYSGESDLEWEWTNCEYISSSAKDFEIELAAPVTGAYYMHMTSWNEDKDATEGAGYFVGSRTTYNTISIDGTMTDWDSDEDVDTDNGDTFYITWDSSNLYFGWTGSNFASGGDLFVYMDVDGTTSGTSTSKNWGGTHSFGSAKMDYAFGAEGDNYYKIFDGSDSWNEETCGGLDAYMGWTDVQNTEVKIPVSCIGSPSQLALIAFAQNENDQGVWQAFPDENPHGGSGSETFTHWYNFGTDFGSQSISPDSASYSQSIPEFSTLALPIASVLAIVGLNFRRTK
ncbi:MAG: hypothetical protein VXX84_03570, partial [Candidatus Thermoplasmatota archaeon]|nr:hypothetical protein [Candidatus Thermoplasmatota archaeon]